MDCWFVAFENVGYRTVCENKIFFCYKIPLQRHYECLKKHMKKTHIYKSDMTARLMNVGLNILTLNNACHAVNLSGCNRLDSLRSKIGHSTCQCNNQSTSGHLRGTTWYSEHPNCIPAVLNYYSRFPQCLTQLRLIWKYQHDFMADFACSANWQHNLLR
jgi:hypothetical protein